MKKSSPNSKATGEDLGKKAEAAAKFANQFFERLAAAARLDGRALDPLFGDLAEEEEEEVETITTESLNTTKNSEPIGRSYYTSQVAVTSSPDKDQKLHRLFRHHFPDFDVQTVSERSFHTSNDEAWNALLKASSNELIDDDNNKVATLLRKDYLDMFWLTKDNHGTPLDVLVVPRYRFLFIEATRTREGLYNRSFRRVLEVFDLKTQAERLENSLLDPYDQGEKEATDALRLLRVQWPTPSHSALKTTQVFDLLERGAKIGSTDGVKKGCQHLLEYWKSLKNLEEISGVLEFAGDDNQKLRPSLLKAGEKALFASNDDEETTISDFDPPAQNDNKTAPGGMEVLTFIGDQADPKETTEVFRECGALVVSDMMATLGECKVQATEAFEALLEEQLEPRGLLLEGEERFELPMARQLKGHRVDNQYKILDNPESPIARLGCHLQQEIPILLCHNGENNFRLDQAGVIHCMPSKPGNDNTSEVETWHCDGSTLFSNAHHDAHCFNVFIPLTDMTDGSATTEFIPGTQLDSVYQQVAPDIAELAERDPAAQHELAVRANIAAGTMLVLDSRMYFRGLPNISLEERQILYFTFAKTWFRKQEEGRQTTFKREIDVHSKLLIVSRLHQLITGVRFHQLASVSESVGHTFFTNRFDLLLLDSLISDDKHVQSAAMANMAAIIYFSKLSDGDKETMAREFVFSLSERAYERRERVLRKARGKRQKRLEITENDIGLVAIVPDTGDAEALIDLTAAIIMEETTLLSKLGFTSDERGIAVLLAMLKAHAKRDSLGCIGITESRLEEDFALWWYARRGRFAFFPGRATSDDDAATRTILVIFSGLDSRQTIPEWNAAVTAASGDSRLDVLHVLDPSFSCFCRDPDGKWGGSSYFFSELRDRISNYESVLFFGDSLGAAAALRFSRLANEVLAFAPVLDIAACKSIARTDFPASVKNEFQVKLLEEIKSSQAKIRVHYSEFSREQGDQLQLLPKRTGIELFGHQCGDADLFSHLVNTSEMSDIMQSAIPASSSSGTPTRLNKICSGKFYPVPADS